MRLKETDAIKPKLKADHTPEWFDSYYFLILDNKQIEDFDRNGSPLIIGGNQSWIRIHNVIIHKKYKIQVQWEIYYDETGFERLSTLRCFNDEEIKKAFCSLDGYGFSQGKFIRWGKYLTLLCQGIEKEGYPSISVLLDDNIIIKVRQLIDG